MIVLVLVAKGDHGKRLASNEDEEVTMVWCKLDNARGITIECAVVSHTRDAAADTFTTSAPGLTVL